MPLKKAGRPAKITPEQWPALLRRSDMLLPAMRALATVEHLVPKRSWEDIAAFLQADYPQQMSFLRKHIPHLAATFEDTNLLATVKGPEARDQLLADALAGAELPDSLSPSYSRSIVMRARRARLRSLKERAAAARA